MLKIEQLDVKERSGRYLLKDISMEIPAGHVIGLTGKSGSGKTTLLRSILGMLHTSCHIDAGKILLDDIDLSHLSRKSHRELCGKKLGFIPQNPMTAFDSRLKIGYQMRETFVNRLHLNTSEATDLAKEKLFGQRERAACAAGFSCGLYDPETIFANTHRSCFTPEMDHTEREARCNGWQKAVELNEIKEITVERTRKSKLSAFQDKLAGLKFLDPACGSGNFLTETFISLRRLENETIMAMNGGQMVIGEVLNPVKVSISQFYGIEINDFAVTVGKTALWIAESQMLKETEDIVHMQLEFLPLKTNAFIVEGNALQIDWESVVPKYELNYIMGNPPFVGARLMSQSQKSDMSNIFDKLKGVGNLDYVSAWYKKSADLMNGTAIKTALVSTNSVCQGEPASILWGMLFNQGIHIDFAYRTFIWSSEAKLQAHVHCVIVGFSFTKGNKKSILYYGDRYKLVNNINGFLLDAPNVEIVSRRKPICSVPEMVFGNMANDGGNLSDYSNEQKEKIVATYPEANTLFKRFLGAREFLHNEIRWCLWLKGVNPQLIKKISPVYEAVKSVKEMRESSSREATKKLAETPQLFGEIRQPETDYLIVPRHSSENRRYIPIGYMNKDTICGDANMLIPSASLYIFGVLMSNVHNSWMRAVCGRIKSDYRYSANMVYNNFPWCNPTSEQKVKIEQTAQGILDARALYPDSSLADLYDEVLMPPELRRAHQLNDKAVMQAYGFPIKDFTESDCVAALMKMYQELMQ